MLNYLEKFESNEFKWVFYWHWRIFRIFIAQSRLMKMILILDYWNSQCEGMIYPLEKSHMLLLSICRPETSWQWTADIKVFCWLCSFQHICSKYHVKLLLFFWPTIDFMVWTIRAVTSHLHINTYEHFIKCLPYPSFNS